MFVVFDILISFRLEDALKMGEMPGTFKRQAGDIISEF